MVLSGVGRLGRDVELRYLQDGTAVANLALAFNYCLLYTSPSPRD